MIGSALGGLGVSLNPLHTLPTQSTTLLQSVRFVALLWSEIKQQVGIASAIMSCHSRCVCVFWCDALDRSAVNHDQTQRAAWVSWSEAGGRASLALASPDEPLDLSEEVAGVTHFVCRLQRADSPLNEDYPETNL